MIYLLKTAINIIQEHTFLDLQANCPLLPRLVALDHYVQKRCDTLQNKNTFKDF